MKYFDSHAHYYDARFESELDCSVDSLIDAIFKESASYIINVGTSLESSKAAIVQSKKYANMYTAIGIHPSDCTYLDLPLEKNLYGLEQLILDKSNKCVALGEIGLDYHYEDTDREKQLLYFEEQMRLAESLKIPVSIHDRDAHGDVLLVLRRHPDVFGVLHSFSGSAEMAREVSEMGYYVSFSGTLTFKNARKPKEAALAVPRDKILIETDCPYLAPHPLRGTLNHSGNLVYTNRALAELLEMDEERAASLTEQNARTLFNIDSTPRPT